MYFQILTVATACKQESLMQVSVNISLHFKGINSSSQKMAKQLSHQQAELIALSKNRDTKWTWSSSCPTVTTKLSPVHQLPDIIPPFRRPHTHPWRRWVNLRNSRPGSIPFPDALTCYPKHCPLGGVQHRAPVNLSFRSLMFRQIPG